MKAVRKRGTAEQDMVVIHTVLQVWNTRLDVGFRTGDRSKRLNVYLIAARSLHRSESAIRKAFTAAWARQCPYERMPSAESRRRNLRLWLRMAGRKLPRSWREEPFVPRGDT